MATARTIITAAMRKLGVLPSGETPRADEADDSLMALNAMLASWNTSSLLVPRINQEVITVTASPYTLASRPMRVLDSTITDTMDYPVSSLSREDWFSIQNKGQTGRPQSLWWDEKMSPLSLYLWPVPDKAYTVTVQRWDPMTVFASLDDVMTLPAEYERALIYNLAIEVASEFGASTPAEVASVASTSLTAIVKYHAKEIPSLAADLVGSIQRRYDSTLQFRGGW